MTDDARESRTPVSGAAAFASGDSGSAKDLISVVDGNNISINDYIFTYDSNGTAQASIELYDEPEGTAAVDAEDVVDVVGIGPGDKIALSEIARNDVEHDLVAVVSDNDADVTVSVGGHVV